MTGRRSDGKEAEMITVLIVDDHAIVRGGLAALLATAEDIEVVGQAADGVEAVVLAAAADSRT